MTTNSGIADPDAMATAAKNRHAWYASWFLRFGVVSIIMLALIDFLPSPWTWIAPVLVGLLGVFALINWARKWPEIVTEHRRTTMIFWVLWVILFVIGARLALQGNLWWLALGAAILALGVLISGMIRKKAAKVIDSDWRVTK